MSSLAMEVCKYGIVINTVAPLAKSRLSSGWPSDWDELFSAKQIAPLIAYLCSTECADTGMLFCAGGGHFSRAFMAENHGINLSHQESISPDEIAASFSKITSKEAHHTFASGVERVIHAAKTVGSLNKGE
jgi:hypothetical protein